MTDDRFNEFFLTSILSELMIEKLNYMITTPRGLSFYSTGLFYILLGIIGELWDQQKLY